MASVDESACAAGPMGKSCPTGQWCCMDESAQKSVCVPCSMKLFGRCLQDDKDVCTNAGLKPWNNLAEAEDVALKSGESIGKAAIEAWLKAHGYSLPS